MSKWDDNIVGEFRVVWRWRDRGYPGSASDSAALYPIRRKGYKTRAGAERLLAKLQSNGGKYDASYETEPTRYEDGLITVPLILDSARLEVREVGPWQVPCVCGEWVEDSSGEGGCGNCGADREPLEAPE